MKKGNSFLKISAILLTLSTALFLSCICITEIEPVDSKTVPAAENEPTTSGGLPPLDIDISAPLLLDEPSEEEQAFAAAGTRAASENTACFVCHANYKTEFLVSSHAKVNIGCFNCHGESSAHQNDENNITPPGIMYPADKIDLFCQSCHKVHNISSRKIIANWMEKKSKGANTSCLGQECHQSDDIPPEKVVTRWKELAIDKTDPEKIVCTDCHGDHRMKVRTIIWDKESGKLLRTNKGD